MKKTIGFGLLTIFILTIAVMPIFGGGQVQKRVDFSINVPFALRMGDYKLPAGEYVLRQVIPNDVNLFALYPVNLTNEPIAMVRTTRLRFPEGTPDETKLFVEMEETSTTDTLPVLQGWVIPGLDGWEVISVVEKKTGVLGKLDYGITSSSGEYRLDKAQMNFDKYKNSDKRSWIKFKQIKN